MKHTLRAFLALAFAGAALTLAAPAQAAQPPVPLSPGGTKTIDLQVARTRERHQQIHERTERGDSLHAIARGLQLSRGTVNRFARAAEVDELLAAAQPSTGPP
ncbi:hypothetical protein [Streptomyces sp. DSM 40907]|uniref:hypothetical protein n=1 Tax=Streptomyces kutzneri TaxID=3051179 RepID=UPI0028D07005|nr:hypothetical protein [Streptomyces sp. DSM 40907]